MHPIDTKERDHLLYKVNDTTAEQLLENLTILLEKHADSDDKEEEIEFPCVDQMMKIIRSKTGENKLVTKVVWKFQQPLAVVWDQSDGTRKWFFGQNEDMFRVDHLVGSYTDWKRPVNDDIQNETKHQQIIPCEVTGDWVFEKRHSIFKVDNVQDIEAAFEQYFT